MSGQIDIPSHKIMSLEPEKLDRIINAALGEFRHGFKKASTDAIVREAGISKGMLFHYFKTKEELYEFLLWYALDVTNREYIDLVNFSQRDIIERLRQMTLLKMDLGYKYPDLSTFMLVAYAHDKDDPCDQFSDILQALQDKMSDKLQDNIDHSLFRKDIDVQKAINIIQWALFGYNSSHVSKEKDFDAYQENFEAYLSEIDEYFALFRKLFYK